MKLAIPSALLLLLGLVAISFVSAPPSVAEIETTSSPRFDAEAVSGIEFAVLDYVEGIYDVKPSRIERSVSKDLVKYGFWRQSADAEYNGSAMTYDQLLDLAGSWNEGNKRDITDKTPKEIVILDVLDKTATAKLTAYWGIDYFQLEKTGDQWVIRHVLWQSHP